MLPLIRLFEPWVAKLAQSTCVTQINSKLWGVKGDVQKSQSVLY